MGLKFDEIFESVVSRYTVGGFLPGDLVKFRPDYKSCDCYKAMHSTMKHRVLLRYIFPGEGRRRARKIRREHLHRRGELHSQGVPEGALRIPAEREGTQGPVHRPANGRGARCVYGGREGRR